MTSLIIVIVLFKKKLEEESLAHISVFYCLKGCLPRDEDLYLLLPFPI